MHEWSLIVELVVIGTIILAMFTPFFQIVALVLVIFADALASRERSRSVTSNHEVKPEKGRSNVER